MQLAILVCWPRDGARGSLSVETTTRQRNWLHEAMQSDDKTGGQHFNFTNLINEQLNGNDNTDSNVLCSSSYEIDDLKHILNKNETMKCAAIHINIHSIPAKLDKLKIVLSSLHNINIDIQFILLCETFLSDNNCNLCNIPGYNLICKDRAVGKRGGVAIYKQENMTYKNRPDLEINVENEFESLFIDTTINNEKVVVGEIYRVPNTSEPLSVIVRALRDLLCRFVYNCEIWHMCRSDHNKFIF